MIYIYIYIYICIYIYDCDKHEYLSSNSNNGEKQSEPLNFYNVLKKNYNRKSLSIYLE